MIFFLVQSDVGLRRTIGGKGMREFYTDDWDVKFNVRMDHHDVSS
jgi:hypothetical protein